MPPGSGATCSMYASPSPSYSDTTADPPISPQTSQMPEWAHPMAAEAILETKQFYAANPQILAAQTSNATDTSNSATDTSGAGGAPTATDAAGNSTSSSASGGIDLTGSAGRPLSAASSAVVGFAVVALVSLVLA